MDGCIRDYIRDGSVYSWAICNEMIQCQIHPQNLNPQMICHIYSNLKASDLTTAEYTNKSWRHMTSWAYPNATFEMRREIWRVHKTYQQGLLWFLTTDPELSPAIRDAVSQWGLCADEFKETGGWPPALYIRESRRMVGDIVLNQSSVRMGVGMYSHDLYI